MTSLRAPISLSLLVMLTCASACASAVRYALLGTRAYPTTEGEALIEERDDGSYDVSLEVDNLPSLDRLGEGATTYVVWITPHGADRPIRAGVLEVDAATRTGLARTVSPSASLTVRVTGEASAEPESPSEAIVVDAVLQAAD